MSLFDDMYRATPPWDIGRPQRAVIELAEAGAFAGRVLDVGCGTGDNALYLARAGYDVVGVDVAGLAIERALDKARAMERPPRFTVADAFELSLLGTTFDTVLDCGLFHTLPDDARAAYISSVAQVVPPGAVLHILCFSDDEPDWGGPRRITRAELLDLGGGFFLDVIVPARFENTTTPPGAAAWRASYTFAGRGPTTLQ